MKTKIFGGIAVLAIAVVVVAFNVNLNLKKTNNQASLLAFNNVEALAGSDYTDTGVSVNGENGGNNDFWTMLTQGATKDEWSREWECEVSYTVNSSDQNLNGSANLTVPVYGTPVGISGGYNSGGTSTTTNVKTGGTKVECFDGGTINCTPKDC